MSCGQSAAGAPVDWLERAALGASALCLIHCAGLPLLLAALPALSKLVALPEHFHVWLLAFAVPSSGMALFLGYRGHRRGVPLCLGLFGLTLIATGALAVSEGHFETPVTIAGSLCLIAAHVTNWRLRPQGHRHG